MTDTHDIRPITHDDVIASKNDTENLQHDTKLAEIERNIKCLACEPGFGDNEKNTK